MEPYEPGNLPPENIHWESHIYSIGKANAAIARYDGIIQGIINPEILLSPLLYQEAVLSSQIEGSQASLEDVLNFEGADQQGATPEKRDDILEVVNYRRGMKEAVKMLDEKPLTINLIREFHRILLTSVRGKEKEPGEIRTRQNWIGSYGVPIERATFVPPEPMRVWDALTDWENYLHVEEKDALVQLAILKGQFELIHPFRDGNGRIGRMLVPLILYYKKVLSSPNFYVSAFFERNRNEYYTRLQMISKEGDWDGWISFFLHAIIEQSKENSKQATDIRDLYNSMKIKIPDITRSQYAVQTIDAIFTQPLFNTPKFISMSNIPKDSAVRILKELTSSNVLKIMKEGKGRSPTVYLFSQLFEITEGIKGLL